MTRIDRALRTYLDTAARAFRFQPDPEAAARSAAAFQAAHRKLTRAEDERRREGVPDGEELLNYSYEAIHAAAQGLAYALGYSPSRDSELGHSGVFSFIRAVCSKLAPQFDSLDRVNTTVRPMRHKALYDHLYPTREAACDAFDIAGILVDGLEALALAVPPASPAKRLV